MPNRLRSFTAQEIQKLWKSVVLKTRRSGITLFMAPKMGATARLLIITPRTSGPAPKRNLIRRRLKAIFYEEKLFERGYDYIVKISKAGIATPFDQLKELMLESLTDA